MVQALTFTFSLSGQRRWQQQQLLGLWEALSSHGHAILPDTGSQVSLVMLLIQFSTTVIDPALHLHKDGAGHLWMFSLH